MFLAGLFTVVLNRVTERVLVHEIIARVVRRIDVDHVDLTVVRALQQLEYLEVVAFNVQVLGGVPVHAFLFEWAQRGCGWSLRLPDGLMLSGPSKRIAFLAGVDVFAEQFAKLIEVDIAGSLSDGFREEFPEPLRSTTIRVL